MTKKFQVPGHPDLYAKILVKSHKKTSHVEWSPATIDAYDPDRERLFRHRVESSDMNNQIRDWWDAIERDMARKAVIYYGGCRGAARFIPNKHVGDLVAILEDSYASAVSDGLPVNRDDW